jgi:hypothetical protein
MGAETISPQAPVSTARMPFPYEVYRRSETKHFRACQIVWKR